MPVAKTPRAKEFVKLLHTRLPDAKVTHCVYVAEFLASFAPTIGVNHDAAVTAGLLHDLCRTMSKSELIEQAEEYGLPVSEYYRENPVLLHGPIAAEELWRNLDIEDKDIYQAIYWHTTGKPGYCMLGQGLYLADFAEPNRKHPEAAQARDILRKDGFQKAIVFAADAKVNHLKKKSAAGDPESVGFLSWLEEAYR